MRIIRSILYSEKRPCSQLWWLESLCSRWHIRKQYKRGAIFKQSVRTNKNSSLNLEKPKLYSGNDVHCEKNRGSLQQGNSHFVKGPEYPGISPWLRWTSHNHWAEEPHCIGVLSEEHSIGCFEGEDCTQRLVRVKESLWRMQKVLLKQSIKCLS